jgi:cytochrome c oxidase subunit I
MELQKGLQKIILIELLVPLALLVFGSYHGVMQVLYRAGVLHANSFAGIEYYQGLTLHGVINAIVLTTFFAVALGNVYLSQQLESPLSIFGSALSMILMLLGAVMAAVMVFVGKATVLYTFYPPLKAHPVFYAGLALFIVGSWIALYTWIPVYLRWRKANPGKKTPLGVVGMFATFVIWQIATLPVAYEVLVQLLPWSLGWTSGVNVVLARTLFWFFGHPLVYFWLLPTYVMYYTMLPRLAGGKLFSDFAGRISFLSLLVLSSPIGIHHQFADPGISSTWKATVGGPVFLGILGMSLFLIAGILKKPVRSSALAVAVPYVWTLGTFIFSTGLFWGGLRGEPRRTNLGLTYLNPASPNYRSDWWITTHIGMIGGVIMGLAILLYFIVLIRSVARAREASQLTKPFSIPLSEAYHDEDIPAVRDFAPWVPAAVLIAVAAYYMPIHEIVHSHIPGAVGYHPDSPVAVETQRR